MNTIAWIGFCQSLFAAILMFTKKDSSLPDRILSGWLTLLSIEFLTCGLDYEIFGRPLLSSSFLLFNPAMFLYVSSLTRKSFHLHITQLLHLLPFVFFEIYTYITQQAFELDTFFDHNEHFIFRMSFALATIISWLIYNTVSLMYVHRYRIHLKNEWSNIEKNETLGWILAVVIFYVVYCSLTFAIAAFTYFVNFNPLTPHVYNYIMLLFLIYIMSFYGLKQSYPTKQIPPQKHPEAYKNSHLNAEKKEEIKHKIILYMENKKAYMNPDLNMDMLSTELKFPKYQITEVLNTSIGKNFFRFVNGYRVEAVKLMLLEPKNHYSIEAIGYDCGFSSKSSFYTVFKSITGETPISFRENNRHAEF